MKKLLIIFAKNPKLGAVKTRLAKSIGKENALSVYVKLIAHTQRVTEALQTDKAVYYSQFIDENDDWDADVYNKEVQKGGDLGERMNNAITQELNKGYDAVCLIGTDCYEINTDIINAAFKKLESNDVVVGPAKDGGYYLIGMKNSHPSVFDIEQWSTHKVFSETINKIEKAGLTYSQTRMLNDIDEEADLKGTDLLNDD